MHQTLSCGRGHLALEPSHYLKGDRCASVTVVYIQWTAVLMASLSVTSQASKFDSSGLKMSILP